MTESTDAIINLEIQMSFLESTVETLNAQLVAQQQALSALQKEQAVMKALLRKLAGSVDDGSEIVPFDLLADRPPHY